MPLINSINRFLSGLLSLVNILAIAPIAALVYSASYDKLNGALPSHDQVIAISILLTIVAIAMFNGTIAVLLNCERDLRNLSMNKKAEDMPEETSTVMLVPAKMPAKKMKTKKKKAKKAGSKKAVAKKTVAKKAAAKKAGAKTA